ncbi:MAG: phenylalanine--tRNA ligase subunit beta [Candidatus Pacearchaeota archaeon]
MAIVTLNKKEIKKIVGNLSDEKINNELSMFGLGVEKISKDTIDVEVTPNRPDMLSQSGILRALNVYYGKKQKQYKLHTPEKNFEVKIDTSVKNVRPFTACAIVKNLNLNDEKIKEIIDIQEKLHSTIGRNRKKVAIGIYPLEKIKLPIRFEARAPKDIRFIPLESKKEMNGIEILEQHPTGRKYAHLLEGKSLFPVFVDSTGEILSMPPIINSQKTGKITENTKEVFVECSGFDFEILKKTLNIIVTMLADMNGEIYQMNLDYGKNELTPDMNPEKIRLSIENTNKLLGLNLNEKEIAKLLEKMGYSYKNNTVLIPPWRTDIMHEVDIIEDIAISYGYGNFKPEIPSISTIGEENKQEILKRKIANILIGMEMLELSTLHLITKEDAKKFGLKNFIEIEESKSDYKILRPSLLLSTLKVLSENIDKEYPQKVFEIGTIFELDSKEESGVKEKDKLIVALAPGNFTEAKQILEYLGKMLGMEFEIKKMQHESLIEGRTGKITFKGKDIGIIGEISPQLLSNFKLEVPVSIFEIDIFKFY